jgi:PAS domain S-box-containing protein
MPRNERGRPLLKTMTLPARPPSIATDPETVALPHADGHLLRIIAGGRADRRRTGPHAKRREERYRRFLDALGVAVYTTDADGRITFYNEAAAAFWGRRPQLGEEWCGSYRILTPDGEWLPHDQCPMAIALRENRPVRGVEAIAERPDGTRAWFMPFPTPLRDESGDLIGAVNVLVDLTEQRRIEAELRRTANALNISNAVKDEFLGLVSHELRTPVTTIFGNARLLQDRADTLAPETKTAMVADIAADAERLHEIIENLLQLTRLGSNPQPDLEPQVLERVARRTVQSFQRRRPTRRIVFQSPPVGALVEADRTWLEIVVENLLSNADKYSPPDAPIDVALSLDGDRDGGEEVTVRVSDRGIGLGDTDPESLFQPFYRGANARRAANGIGVGLSVCERIVSALGGRIWARPRPGGGAEVGFTLPTAREALDLA